MSNVSIKERLEIDRRKLASKERRRQEHLFELGMIETDIRSLNDRIHFNEKRLAEQEQKRMEKGEQHSLFEEPNPDEANDEVEES